MLKINNLLIVEDKDIFIKCCAECKFFCYDGPQPDQPYPEFWCSKSHWGGISCNEELYEPNECLDYECKNQKK